MRHHRQEEHPEIRDYGGEPFIFNISHATNMNQNFRTTLWTGRDLQLTLMSIPVGGDIGVDIVNCTISPFIDGETFDILYTNGGYLRLSPNKNLWSYIIVRVSSLLGTIITCCCSTTCRV